MLDLWPVASLSRPDHARLELLLLHTLLLKMHPIFIKCFNGGLLRLQTSTPLLSTSRGFLYEDCPCWQQAILAAFVINERVFSRSAAVLGPLRGRLMSSELVLRVLNLLVHLALFLEAASLWREEIRLILMFGDSLGAYPRELARSDNLARGADMTCTSFGQRPCRVVCM